MVCHHLQISEDFWRQFGMESCLHLEYNSGALCYRHLKLRNQFRWQKAFRLGAQNVT